MHTPSPPPELFDRPLVNHWFAHLNEVVAGVVAPQEVRPVGQFRHTIALTHDVDVMRKYRGLRGARRALSEMVRSTAVADATGEMRYATLVLAGIRRDPYDSFDTLYTLKEKIGAQSTFFIMGGGHTSLDSDYNLDDPSVRQLLSRARAFRDEVAVHPSYNSCRSEPAIRSEMTAVSEAWGETHPGLAPALPPVCSARNVACAYCLRPAVRFDHGFCRPRRFPLRMVGLLSPV